jgi:FMN-dependent NADH-azoreductase
LKSVLAFLGMTDVEFIYAEGLALGAESADKAFAEAQEQIRQLAA